MYVYPAQVLFCNAPWASLGGLRGRKVRTSSLTQPDWVEALGGKPLRVQFAEVVPKLRAGNRDCAITGTMSGNTIGLHDITTHLHTLAVSWGMSVFVAHAATWRTLPEDLRSLLQRELPKLETAICDEAARETDEGVACKDGASGWFHAQEVGHWWAHAQQGAKGLSVSGCSILPRSGRGHISPERLCGSQPRGV